MTPDQRTRLAHLRRRGFGLPAARDLADCIERAESRRRVRIAVPHEPVQRDESSKLGNVLACIAIVLCILTAALA